MATYYVRNDGNDANTGLGSTTALAWKTVQKALGATGIGSGDTVYIAPGVYRENITIAGTYTAATYIIGDTTASQFTGVSQGLVRLTNYLTTDTASPSGVIVVTNNKNYLNFSNLYFDGSVTMLGLTNSNNCVVENCAFIGSSLSSSIGITGSFSTGVTVNNVIRKCIFMTGSHSIYCEVGGNHTSDWSIGITIQDCAFIGSSPVTASSPAIRITRTTGAANLAGGINIYNCYIQSAVQGIAFDCGNVTYPTNVRNCIITNCNIGIAGRGTTTNIQDYNRIIGCAVSLSSVATGANTVTVGPLMVDIGMSQLFGLSAKQTWFSALPGSLNIGFGDPTGALSTDLFGATWFNGGSDPDAGALTSIQLSGTSYYQPTERNASTITIAPGSTSQSIELYLGVTGLTASTSGLSAYYNRTRSADVQINLQARNITQNWTSGGFAEVNANTMPGVYRLDIPNEALAAGADDVTVVVRGASGTNGAVMSIKLSSGGLTSAQTASAVWDAATTSYTNNGSFGLNLLRADQQNKQGLVTLSSAGNVNRVDADVHAIANDIAAATALKGALNHDGTGYIDSDVVRISTSTAAANELEGALLHNGTDYIDSNLLSGNSTRVFVGRFQLTQTGTTQGDIIEAFTTDTPSFELQLFDGDNNIVPVTGATLGLRILDVTSTVVETGTPTIEYGTGGIVRWTAPGSYVSIGCPAGMYRLFVDRTVSGTTTTFGPLQIKVQVQ